jgi:hypothetical protein
MKRERERERGEIEVVGLGILCGRIFVAFGVEIILVLIFGD